MARACGFKKRNKKKDKSPKRKKKEQNQKQNKDRTESNSHDNHALQKRQEPLGPKQRGCKTRQDLNSMGRLKSSYLVLLICSALLLPASASSTLVDCPSSPPGTSLSLSVGKNLSYTFSPETPDLGAPQGYVRTAVPWSCPVATLLRAALLQSCPCMRYHFANFDAWKVSWRKKCRHVEKVGFRFLRKSLFFGNWFTPKDRWLPLFYLWFGVWGFLAFWGWFQCLRERYADPLLKTKKNTQTFSEVSALA